MKIAVSTHDGKTICGHLGKCNQFIVFEADVFGIKNRIMRGVSGSSSLLHDCQAVITQGMGRGIYDGLMSAGIIPVITMESDPESAVRQFLINGGVPGTYQGNSSCGDH
jgi:predicted Fe-Mo cluster-binding NifX family protein